MKKKYTKPELTKIPRGQWAGHGHTWGDGTPQKLKFGGGSSGHGKSIDSNINHGKPIEFTFSKEIKPEIRFNPMKLPESVSIEGPECPNCGTNAKEMVMYGVTGVNSLFKNHCRKCGHNWGPGE